MTAIDVCPKVDEIFAGAMFARNVDDDWLEDLDDDVAAEEEVDEEDEEEDVVHEADDND